MGERLVVFNAVEKRLFGLVHIAEGLAIIVAGGRAPSLTYHYAKRQARKRAGV